MQSLTVKTLYLLTYCNNYMRNIQLTLFNVFKNATIKASCTKWENSCRNWSNYNINNDDNDETKNQQEKKAIAGKIFAFVRYHLDSLHLCRVNTS